LHHWGPQKLICNEDQSVSVDGCKIFGTPWTPRFGNKFVAFTQELGSWALWWKWQAIPIGTDVLVTHVPPLGRRDLTKFGVRAGCGGDCFFRSFLFFALNLGMQQQERFFLLDLLQGE